VPRYKPPQMQGVMRKIMENKKYRLDFKTYVSVIAVFGFAQGLIAGVVSVFEGIMVVSYLQTIGVALIIPVVVCLGNAVLGVITYPIYKVISDLIKGHKITRLVYKTS